MVELQGKSVFSGIAIGRISVLEKGDQLVKRHPVQETEEELARFEQARTKAKEQLQRLYEKAFDQVMISPTPLWQFIAGQIIGGSLRGLYAGGIILLLTAPIETGLIFNGWSFLVMFLNGAVFSAIGVVVSFLAKNHADVPRFSNYIIMPMAYLCNTFFSTEKLPGFVGKFVSALPLSQTSHLMRSISSGEAVNYTGIGILLLYLLVFTVAASWFIYKKKNL